MPLGGHRICRCADTERQDRCDYLVVALDDLPCPICGNNIDVMGPAVASNRSKYDPKHGPSGIWNSFWVPFVEDLRGGQQRLVHPRCYADESGFDALISLVTRYDQQVRERQAHRSAD